MYKGMKAPAKNKNGLIIPPDPAKVSPEVATYYGEKSKPDRHHIYFPRVVFASESELSFKFREHRFNSIWLPRFQHDKLHNRYDELIRKYPKFMMPRIDVMETFLEEAQMLDELNVCVRAIDMIDDAIYEGKVVHINRTLEKREEKLEIISTVVELSRGFEVVSQKLAQTAMSDAFRLFAHQAA
jgi:hypothetical protein